MYCSSSDEVDYMCNETTNPMKNGFPKLGIPGIETLLWRYNVDVAIWAHEHNYERMWPVYDGKVKNGSSQVCFCVSNYSANVVMLKFGVLIVAMVFNLMHLGTVHKP